MSDSIPTFNATILPLAGMDTDRRALDLQAVGGKGANLARMARAGFPVPGGFLVTTQSYRTFVASNGLEEDILAVISAVLPAGSGEDLALLEAASARIRSLFTAGELPGGLADGLLAGYRNLGEPAVAVRSSATAEDLPDMSFAGQQDTYLNVLGREALLKAVVDCWSSLWTARAIGYRMRNGVPHSGAALAVIVQEMVQSQASGVLFTANPLTGLRTETVIDATFGLGEALVSGQVEPDHYVVEIAAPAAGSQGPAAPGRAVQVRIVSKTLGAKAVAIYGRAGGGTALSEINGSDQQALPNEQILDLARLGAQVAAEYGFPQDIEWAVGEKGELYLLQSRPITALYPTPQSMPPEPLKVMFSFGAVQGFLDPITPLGQDALRVIAAVAAGFFGVRATSETQAVFLSAGERLWMNVTPVMRSSAGRRVLHGALGFAEPTIRQALDAIWDDPRLQPEKRGISLRALRQMAGFFLPLAGNILLNLHSPRARREYIVENGENVLELMRVRFASVTGDRYARLRRQADLLAELAEDSLPRTFLLFVSGVGAGVASLNLLNKLAADLAKEGGSNEAQPWSDQVLEVTRGLPNNPTTEMDLRLWEIARAVRGDPSAWQEFRKFSSPELAERFCTGEMSPAAQQLIRRFLDQYGGRGLGEIDLGRPRWDEDPTHVFEVLAGYLQIEEGDQAPDLVFARGAETAQKSADLLVTALRKIRFGPLKARLARFFISRVRELMGLRERPKFFAVRMLGLVRQELLKTAAEFVQTGELGQVDDLMYLTFAELRLFAAREARDWRALILHRRETYGREMLRRQIPRLLLSDGRAFYEGLSAADRAGGVMAGSPVSPGSAEGRVRVVFDPRQAHLLPGEILVCPGTDPSWTPLFLIAAGLIMEVGGMMTHGAVVAREYGIPAIVGVHRATERLHSGQYISMNGSTGEIMLLENGVQ
jgi:pyruvate,water dikinase